MNRIITTFYCVVLLAALVIFGSFCYFNYALAQTEQNFSEHKFGISMQYPAKWTFVPTEEEEKEQQDYAAGRSANLGSFCPTASLGNVFGSPDCGADVPLRLSISVNKLENGTTSKEFYDFNILPFLEKASKLLGFRMINVDTKDVNISGLSAIQRMDIRGPDYSGAPEETKHIGVYVAHSVNGYDFEAVVSRGYETYLPTIQKMIDSIRIQERN